MSDYIPEKIIDQQDWTNEILETVNNLAYRARQTNVHLQDSDIIVVEYDGVVYVLANPVLSWDVMESSGVEICLHEWDIISKYQRRCNLCQELQLARHNITLEYYDNPKIERANDQENMSIKYTITAPRLAILRPDLCIKIEKDGVTKCDTKSLESSVANNYLHSTKLHLTSSLDRLTKSIKDSN